MTAAREVAAVARGASARLRAVWRRLRRPLARWLSPLSTDPPAYFWAALSWPDSWYEGGAAYRPGARLTAAELAAWTALTRRTKLPAAYWRID